MNTVTSDSILATQERMAAADRRYEAALARNASFAELYGLLMETDERELAYQYAAEQQAVNDVVRAEFIEQLTQHCEWLDEQATRESVRP